MTDKQLSEREIKALQIAATSKLTRKGNTWIVPSQAGHGEYTVNPDPEAPRCTCPDFEFRNARCKHIVAVEYTLMREQKPDGSTVVTETVTVTRKTYKQIDPRNTSRLTACCGELVEMTLGDRVIHCPKCHSATDRDWNASLNILALGLQSIGLNPSKLR